MVDDQSVTKRENNAILKSDMDKREFKITIGIRSYWITHDEMQKYMADRMQDGCEYVVLRSGLLILPVKFQEIVHRSVIEDSEKVEEGRWECENGKWHSAGGTCRCNTELIEGSDGMLYVQKKNAPPALEPAKKQLNMHTVSNYL